MKKQETELCIALSTAEAEYIALSAAAPESVWVKQFLSDLGPPTQPITLFEDNQSAIAMTRNLVSWTSETHRHKVSLCERASSIQQQLLT